MDQTDVHSFILCQFIKFQRDIFINSKMGTRTKIHGNEKNSRRHRLLFALNKYVDLNFEKACKSGPMRWILPPSARLAQLKKSLLISITGAVCYCYVPSLRRG